MFAAGAQQFGIELYEVRGAQLLDRHPAKMRDYVKPKNLPVTLDRLRAEIQAEPIALPTVGKFGDRLLRRINAGTGGILGD
jgi:hypothetical protein